jgi:hypothetical protein
LDRSVEKNIRDEMIHDLFLCYFKNISTLKSTNQGEGDKL